MARPPLRPEERKDERLPNLRVTASERALIEERAANAGLTLVEYCRRAIFKSRIAPRRGTADQALLAEISSVGLQLRGMCTNLNQITKNNNAGRNLPPHFSVVLDEATDLLGDLKTIIRKLDHGS